MWIGYLSFFSEWHTEPEIACALEEAGHEVWRYHYTKVDKAKFLEKNFDLIITALPQCFPAQFWDSVRAPKVAWYFDWIRNWGNREQTYLPVLRHFDLILSTDGFDNDIYKGFNRHWMPHGVDTKVYHPIELIPNWDCGFIGHSYTQFRKSLLRNLGKRYSFIHMGNSEECWGPKYAEACNRVKIVVGDNCVNDFPGYWSDRLYLSLACGAFLMYPRVPGIERYFKDGEHLVLWDDERDLHEKINHYLSAPEERKRIAANGAREVAKNHNWTVRVKEALDIIEEIL